MSDHNQLDKQALDRWITEGPTGFREFGDNDDPSTCPHGYEGFCPWCTPVDKTAETAGLPVATFPEQDGRLSVALALVGFGLAVASAIGVAVWLL